MKKEKKVKKYLSLIIGTIFLFVLLLSCTRTEPKITYGFIKLVQYESETIPEEYFSFFILAEDDDGYENLEQLYLYHDIEQLRWHMRSSEWRHFAIDGKNWIGTRSIAVPDGDLPRGIFRVVLVNKGGEKTERNFTYDGSVRFPFPALDITGGNYIINSLWPVNHLVLYDSSGNYINTITPNSLTGSVSQLRLPSGARSAALWAEDEDNFSSAFTNVVPIN